MAGLVECTYLQRQLVAQQPSPLSSLLSLSSARHLTPIQYPLSRLTALSTSNPSSLIIVVIGRLVWSIRSISISARRVNRAATITLVAATPSYYG
jgi:hypothetical protein